MQSTRRLARLPPAAIAHVERLLASYDHEIAAVPARGAADEATLLDRRRRILARVLHEAASTGATSSLGLSMAQSASSSHLVPRRRVEAVAHSLAQEGDAYAATPYPSR